MSSVPGRFVSRVCRLEDRVSEIDTRTKQVEHKVHGLAESGLENRDVLTGPFKNFPFRMGPACSKGQPENWASVGHHPWHMYQQLIRKDSISDALNLSLSRDSCLTGVSGNGSSSSEFNRVTGPLAGPCAEGKEQEHKLSRWSALFGKVTLDRGIVCLSFFKFASSAPRAVSHRKNGKLHVPQWHDITTARHISLSIPSYAPSTCVVAVPSTRQHADFAENPDSC